METDGQASVTGQFRHDAFLYRDDAKFVAGVVPFVREGLGQDEPVLVAVDSRKIDLLREALGLEADRVSFADMPSLGRNPSFIIPAWEQFVSERLDGTAVRGVGEPIWPGRSGPELVESQYHESLLNLAFADTWGFRLLCPYDASRLEPAILREAERSHRHLTDGRTETASDRYGGVEAAAAMFSAPLADPPRDALRLSLPGSSLAELRAFVVQQATRAGLNSGRAGDLVLAVNEVATNSLRYGGGYGTLLTWREPDRFLCEVRDSGRFASPLLDRRRPSVDREDGRGLWMANRLCDLVQIRSSSAGSAVRLHIKL